MPSADVTLTQEGFGAAGAGTNLIVAGGDKQRILVYGFFFLCSAPVGVKWQHALIDFHPALPFLASGGMDLWGVVGEPLFVCAEGEPLNLHLGAAVPVFGSVWYKKVGARV